LPTLFLEMGQILQGWRKCAMSNEKPHTDEARKRVQGNRASAVASQSALSTCSALSRQVGVTRHTGCSLPPRAPACNLFPHLAALHVTIAFQLYSNCISCVFLRKIPCFFTFITFLFLASVIESKREYFLLCSRTSGSSNLKVPFLLALVLSRFYFHFFLSTLKEVLSRG
jgi:hypothetical protein